MFCARVKEGQVSLFSNLWQCLDMLTAAMGWELREAGEEREPYVTARPRRGAQVEIPAGRVHGFRHRIWERHPDGRHVTLEVRGYIQPTGPEERPRSTIRIEGEPGVEVSLGGELIGERGVRLVTAAPAVNAIPHVIAAPPGLVSLKDLPVNEPTGGYRRRDPLIAGASARGVG